MPVMYGHAGISTDWLCYCGRMENSRRRLRVRRGMNKRRMDTAAKAIRRVKGEVYLVTEEMNLAGLGKNRRQVVAIVLMLDRQVAITVIIAAAESDGHFADHTYRISDLQAILIHIRKNTEPAGAVQEHADKNNQTENSLHFAERYIKSDYPTRNTQIQALSLSSLNFELKTCQFYRKYVLYTAQ